MKLSTLLSACAISLFLTACTTESEPATAADMVDSATDAVDDAADAAADAVHEAGEAIEDHADHDH